MISTRPTISERRRYAGRDAKQNYGSRALHHERLESLTIKIKLGSGLQFSELGSPPEF